MTDTATTYPPSAIGHNWTPGEHSEWHHHKKRFSGQPVIAGIVAALAVQIVLGLFGVALGFGAVSASNASAYPSAETVKIGASMWAAVSILSALFYGGFIAARLSKSTCHHEGILHGIVVWAATVVVLAFFVSSAAGAIFGGASQIMYHPSAQSDYTRSSGQTAVPVDQTKLAAENAATAKAALGAAVVLLLGAFTSALGGSLGIAHVKHDRERHLQQNTKA